MTLDTRILDIGLSPRDRPHFLARPANLAQTNGTEFSGDHRTVQTASNGRPHVQRSRTRGRPLAKPVGCPLVTVTVPEGAVASQKREGSGPGVRRKSALRLAQASWQPLLLLLLVLFGTPLFGASDVFPLLTLAGIYGVALVGVSLLAGLGGQFSLGQAAFMGIGAYASAMCTVRLSLPPLVGLVVGIGAGLLIAFVTSPVLRLRGWYLAMASIALAFIFQQVVVNLKGVTGGNNGVYGIPPLSIGGFQLTDPAQYFQLGWGVVIVLLVVGRNAASSRFGRALAAINKDEEAAASAAINCMRYKATLWILASVPAAIAGTLFAHYSAFVSPGDFSLSTSLTLFVAVLLGGERSIFAGLLALIFLVCLPSFASTDVFTSDLIKGLALIIIYTLSPTGISGLLGRPVDSVKSWFGRRARRPNA